MRASSTEDSSQPFSRPLNLCSSFRESPASVSKVTGCVVAAPCLRKTTSVEDSATARMRSPWRRVQGRRARRNDTLFKSNGMVSSVLPIGYSANNRPALVGGVGLLRSFDGWLPLIQQQTRLLRVFVALDVLVPDSLRSPMSVDTRKPISFENFPAHGTLLTALHRPPSRHTGNAPVGLR